MSKCPKCGSYMTFWMSHILGTKSGEQIRLCRNEKGKACRYKQFRLAPKKTRDRIKRRWRKVIDE